MKRQHEFFEPNKINHSKVLSISPSRLYPQETDWTCSVACLRTILSGIDKTVPSEEDLVRRYNMQPGPYYSKDIKTLGILNNYDAVYGCDNKDVSFDDILSYVEIGYSVMLECLINYAHWLVLLGYYPLDNTNIEKSQLMLYDPYYDQIRLVNADEFINMWIDGDFANTKVEKDFVAVKA